MTVKDIWGVVKQAFSDFFDDDAMNLGASLAFYTALSFAPLLLLMLFVTGLLGHDTQNKLVGEVTGLVGKQAGELVNTIKESASEQKSARTLAGVIGVLTLLFSASGVFAQLQDAMNRVWEVKPKPGQGVWAWLRKRIVSAGMIFAILFILIVSLGVSTALSLFMGQGGGAWQVVNVVVSLLVFTALFGLIFKVLPDVKINWSDVLVGAAVTSVLFTVGKWAIGLYLGHGAVSSAYGAAGSLLALLIWVYYSSLILFFGAEVTQAVARARGSRIEPDAHAVWADQESQEKKKPADMRAASGG